MVAPERARLRLARVEEAVPYAPAAPGRQQHGLGAVEHPLERQPGCREGRAEIARVVFHRRSGRGADQPVAGVGPDQDRARPVAIAAQVGPLVVRIAVVEIGPVAEHRDPERGQIVERLFQRGPRQAAQRDRHVETWAIQSLRL